MGEGGKFGRNEEREFWVKEEKLQGRRIVSKNFKTIQKIKNQKKIENC